MARLIDADEFMKEIRKWLGNETDFRSLQEIIAGMPTIDPVKHGWWIDLEVENSTGKIFGCSVCNRTHNPNRKDVKIGRAKEKPDYCPNCGARMDGE